MPTSDSLTEQCRAGVRLVVLGVTVTDAAALVGVERVRLSRALNSPEGREYLVHLRDLCDHYTAAMGVLGLLPVDVIRPKRGRPVAPPSPHGLRRVVGNRLRQRAGLPPKPTDTDNDD